MYQIFNINMMVIIPTVKNFTSNVITLLVMVMFLLMGIYISKTTFLLLLIVIPVDQ